MTRVMARAEAGSSVTVPFLPGAPQRERVYASYGLPNYGEITNGLHWSVCSDAVSSPAADYRLPA
jgi:hypothetical protein